MKTDLNLGARKQPRPMALTAARPLSNVAQKLHLRTKEARVPLCVYDHCFTNKFIKLNLASHSSLAALQNIMVQVLSNRLLNPITLIKYCKHCSVLQSAPYDSLVCTGQIQKISMWHENLENIIKHPQINKCTV